MVKANILKTYSAEIIEYFINHCKLGGVGGQ